MTEPRPESRNRARYKRHVKRAIKAVGIPLGLRLGSFEHYAPREPRMQADLPPRGDRPADARPRVRIVTPSYNHAAFLGRTVDSVLGQGYPHIAYHVQDGGSGDGTLELLRERDRRDPGRFTWSSEPDAGQADAINRGFQRAAGDGETDRAGESDDRAPPVEIMAWLNSDDLLLPGAVESVVRVFEDRPEVDVVYGHRLILDEHDREVGRWLLPPHEPAALLWRDYIPQETMFWRRSLWERVGGGVNASLQFAMDWDLVLRFHRAGARFHRIDRLIGGFRTHAAQKSVALVEGVGLDEFERLRGRYLPPGSARRRARWASARYLLQSVGYAWRGPAAG